VTRPRYIPQISLGNFITIGIFILGLAIARGEKNSDIKTLETSGEKLESKIEEIAAVNARKIDEVAKTNAKDVKDAEVHIHQLQLSHERIVERLEGIKTSIDRIEKKMP
jgi:hypothetical protein